jgi:serine phosphatase RsbU (regulator of sigma subunit)
MTDQSIGAFMDTDNADVRGARILLVDDVPTNLELLYALLDPEGYRLSMAPNGQAALRIVGEADAVPDLILLDVMMPGMNGFEVCRRLKSDERTRGIPVIFITAEDQTESLVAGFEAGGVDYIGKPFRDQEVLMRVRTHLLLQKQLFLISALSEKNLEQERALRSGMERELQIARDAQMGLMPKKSPCIEGLELAAHCLPAAQVCGDFFQYFHQGNTLSVSTADVTGHAMEAAIPVVMFEGVLDSHMRLGVELEDLFTEVNEVMSQRLTGHTHVCFSMVQINVKTRRLRFANAGCPYPYHYHASTGLVTELQVDAYPLGVRGGTAYQAIEGQLAGGDRLVLCSDGIPEAMNPAGEMFGFDRTAASILRASQQDSSAEAVLACVLGEVRAFSGERPQEDDQTIVVVAVED